MVKNYLKVAIRNLIRNKEYFVINIFGLAVGIACAILVMSQVWEHMEYDNFHPFPERTYRVYIDTKIGGLESKAALSSPLFAFGLKKDIPEIEQACRIFRMQNDIQISFPGYYILDRRTTLFVDSTFFDLFGFKLLKGDRLTCLEKPNSIILSLTLAHKLFKEENPIGKKITVEKEKTWTVTGIVEDYANNSHIKYEAIVSINSTTFPTLIWTTNFLYTYYRLKAGATLNSKKPLDSRNLSPVEKMLTEVFLNKASEEFRQTIGMNPEDLHRKDNYFVLRLQKIRDIHMYSNLKYEMFPNVNFQTFLILIGISILIILIGCINYANLTTARLAGRVREIGIRKILGSQRYELSVLLLAESIIISFISLFFALALVEIAYPEINLLRSSIGGNIQQQLLRLSPFIFGITLFTGIIAGIYPSFYIIRFSPVVILQQQRKFSSGSKGLRGLLVIFQFIFSILIIFSASTIYRQLRFIQKKGVGFNTQKLIVLENATELNSKAEEFRQNLLTIPGIKLTTFSSSVPGKAFQMTSFQSGEDRQKNHLMFILEADSNFIQSYGIRIKHGSPDHFNYRQNDVVPAIINEEAARYLGIKNQVGGQIFMIRNYNNAVKLKVIAIADNFNIESLHSKIQPLVIIPIEFANIRFVSIRLNDDYNQETIRHIRHVWKLFLPFNPFSEFSMDESLGSFYNEERTTGEVALIFSFLAIFIACMGLYSLLSLTTVYRTKEIGIRKVLGAGTKELVFLLAREIFYLIGVAGLIALPLASLISWYWLKRFAYHVPISFTNYCLVFIAVFVVAVFTVYRQLRRTIKAVPADSLRRE